MYPEEGRGRRCFDGFRDEAIDKRGGYTIIVIGKCSLAFLVDVRLSIFMVIMGRCDRAIAGGPFSLAERN